MHVSAIYTALGSGTVETHLKSVVNNLRLGNFAQKYRLAASLTTGSEGSSDKESRPRCGLAVCQVYSSRRCIPPPPPPPEVGATPIPILQMRNPRCREVQQLIKDSRFEPSSLAPNSMCLVMLPSHCLHGSDGRELGNGCFPCLHRPRLACGCLSAAQGHLGKPTGAALLPLPSGYL